MTYIPPEVPGPNPGGPGHYAHHDWHTASVKALDAALVSESAATDADLAALTARADSHNLRDYFGNVVNLPVDRNYGFYAVNGQTVTVWALWNVIDAGTAPGWASPSPVAPYPGFPYYLTKIGFCRLIRQGFATHVGFVVMPQADGMIEFYDDNQTRWGGETQPMNPGDQLYAQWTYPAAAPIMALDMSDEEMAGHEDRTERPDLMQGQGD